SATNLANAYGVAVTGTFVTTTCMLLVLTRVGWRWPRWRVALLGLVLLGLELVFFAGNVLEVVSGGWLPLGVAVVLLTIMTTWRRGRLRVSARRVEAEGPLTDFIARVHRLDPARTPGTAIFPHPTMETAPLALRANLEHNGVLHERVVIVSAEPRPVPRVPPGEQLVVDDLGSPSDGIVHLAVRYGFFDRLDLPASLAAAAEREPLLAGWTWPTPPGSCRERRSAGAPDRAMAAWRKRLFISLAHNAADPAQTFGLPADRTVVMGTRPEI
ncbi:MAG TPA: KUP/HAK/KT family potassium transporter, partial [Acidimicrobiales bacterium]|nr:KUP/HAK/KT family potassium transporter [Acidimicrobiales bacterium]